MSVEFHIPKSKLMIAANRAQAAALEMANACVMAKENYRGVLRDQQLWEKHRNALILELALACLGGAAIDKVCGSKAIPFREALQLGGGGQLVNRARNLVSALKHRATSVVKNSKASQDLIKTAVKLPRKSDGNVDMKRLASSKALSQQISEVADCFIFPYPTTAGSTASDLAQLLASQKRASAAVEDFVVKLLVAFKNQSALAPHKKKLTAAERTSFRMRRDYQVFDCVCPLLDALRKRLEQYDVRVRTNELAKEVELGFWVEWIKHNTVGRDVYFDTHLMMDTRSSSLRTRTVSVSYDTDVTGDGRWKRTDPMDYISVNSPGRKLWARFAKLGLYKTSWWYRPTGQSDIWQLTKFAKGWPSNRRARRDACFASGDTRPVGKR